MATIAPASIGTSRVDRSDGRARVAVTYPDALTTWRLTARAVTEDTRVGATVARTTTTKDLIVRVVTPRFLTEGDEVVMPTIVHNYRDQTRTASVDVRVTGLDTSGRAPRIDGIPLASGGEHRDDWRFVARTPGTATITASAGDHQAAATRMTAIDDAMTGRAPRRHQTTSATAHRTAAATTNATACTTGLMRAS